MCAVVYVVWDAAPQQEARLIPGKVRVVPIHGTSVPRAELQAMVMLVRIITIVLRAAAFMCNRVSLATDSACCIAALNWPGATLGGGDYPLPIRNQTRASSRARSRGSPT